MRSSLDVKYLNKIEFSFDLRGRVTVIGGWSSSGKTFFCTALKLAIAAANEGETDYKIYKGCIVVDELNIEQTKHSLDIPDTLVVIDNFDAIAIKYSDIVDIVNYNSNTQYIV